MLLVACGYYITFVQFLLWYKLAPSDARPIAESSPSGFDREKMVQEDASLDARAAGSHNSFAGCDHQRTGAAGHRHMSSVVSALCLAVFY